MSNLIENSLWPTDETGNAYTGYFSFYFMEELLTVIDDVLLEVSISFNTRTVI